MNDWIILYAESVWKTISDLEQPIKEIGKAYESLFD